MKCKCCDRELDTSDPRSVDCGGDCMMCMAECGDRDCIQYLIEHDVDPSEINGYSVED